MYLKYCAWVSFSFLLVTACMSGLQCQCLICFQEKTAILSKIPLNAVPFYCQLDPFMVTDPKNSADLKGCFLLSRLQSGHADFVLSEKHFLTGTHLPGWRDLRSEHVIPELYILMTPLSFFLWREISFLRVILKT